MTIDKVSTTEDDIAWRSTTATSGAARKTERRSQGRPADQRGSVGLTALVESACDLLAQLPPSAVTWARLARHAKVDPRLLRYYFENRSGALLAAARHLTEKLRESPSSDDMTSRLTPQHRLAARIKQLFSFKIRNPFYHRLIADEIAASPDADSSVFFRDLSRSAVANYEALLSEGESDGTLRRVDPVYLYLMIISVSEFSGAAKAIVDAVADRDVDRAQIIAGYSDFVCDIMLKGLAPR